MQEREKDDEREKRKVLNFETTPFVFLSEA
jgi:hypothetical protein